MMPIPILDPSRWWECPSCHRQHISNEAKVHSPLHECAGQGGLMVPFVEVYDNHGLTAGTVRHVAMERDDMINGESGIILDDRGRAIMSVRTERADGSNDCHVFVPTATARVS